MLLIHIVWNTSLIILYDMTSTNPAAVILNESEVFWVTLIFHIHICIQYTIWHISEVLCNTQHPSISPWKCKHSLTVLTWVDSKSLVEGGDNLAKTHEKWHRSTQICNYYPKMKKLNQWPPKPLNIDIGQSFLLREVAQCQKNSKTAAGVKKKWQLLEKYTSRTLSTMYKRCIGTNWNLRFCQCSPWSSIPSLALGFPPPPRNPAVLVRGEISIMLTNFLVLD